MIINYNCWNCEVASQRVAGQLLAEVVLERGLACHQPHSLALAPAFARVRERESSPRICPPGRDSPQRGATFDRWVHARCASYCRAAWFHPSHVRPRPVRHDDRPRRRGRPGPRRDHPRRAAAPARAGADDAVVVVALDGARWQEVLVATDPRFATGADRGISAEALMRQLHTMIAEGAAVGAPAHGPPMVATGPHFISLPGYTEMFSGRSPTACFDNECAATRLPTLVDEVRARSEDVAVFSSWAAYCAGGFAPSLRLRLVDRRARDRGLQARPGHGGPRARLPLGPPPQLPLHRPRRTRRARPPRRLRRLPPVAAPSRHRPRRAPGHAGGPRRSRRTYDRLRHLRSWPL